jgi:hypothetical protein
MNLELIGRRLIRFGLILLGILTVIFIFRTTKLNFGPINTEIWGHYGDVISGTVGTIFALVGVLFLIINLTEQRRISSRQQVETRFFELVQLHRENVKELESKGKAGRAVFVDIKDEFHELHDIIQSSYTKSDSMKSESEWKMDCVRIAYLITFFGVDNSSTHYLQRLINEIIIPNAAQKKFKSDCLDHLIDNHKIQKANKENIVTLPFLNYDGHQSRLGHYLRHLFQIVTYINDQPPGLFTYQEKYNYIKTLRAQLSTHEQALFLYNAISPLGYPWELDPQIIDINQKLITKYNLIKNLPEGFTRSIKPKDYFPDIFYEFDKNETPNRNELESRYQ